MKVVIDGNLIDTDLIVRITTAYNHFTTEGKAFMFYIHFIQNSSFKIIRTVQGVGGGYYHPNCAGFDLANQEEKDSYYERLKKAENSIELMRKHLIEHWSGGQTKYPDLTIE